MKRIGIGQKRLIGRALVLRWHDDRRHIAAKQRILSRLFSCCSGTKVASSRILAQAIQ